jgi:hypothetical protein
MTALSYYLDLAGSQLSMLLSRTGVNDDDDSLMSLDCCRTLSSQGMRDRPGALTETVHRNGRAAPCRRFTLSTM